eukprot:scaffold28499_cov35-Cyclotella_meneghiniana.AAC.1
MGAMDPSFNHPEFVKDPHERIPMPETEWTPEMREIYEEIISNLGEKVEEDIIENLSPRQGDIVLIQILFLKVTAHRHKTGGKDDLTINKNLRALHRSLLLDALNRNAAFNEVLNIIKNGRYDRVVIGTNPASLVDLYTQAGRQSVYEQATDEFEKKDRIITNMLSPYLTRNYTNTRKLIDVIEGLYNNPAAEVKKLALERNAMMRYMYIEGGLETRYVPIQVSEQPPMPTIDNNEEDENFDYGLDGDVWNGNEMNNQEEDETEKINENNLNDNPNENETPQKEENKSEDDAKPAVSRTTEEEIAAYQLGLEQPNSVIKLDKDKFGSMKENEIRNHLTEKVGPYLRAHYGEYSDELMEEIIKENSFKI